MNDNKQRRRQIHVTIRGRSENDPLRYVPGLTPNLKANNTRQDVLRQAAAANAEIDRKPLFEEPMPDEMVFLDS